MGIEIGMEGGELFKGEWLVDGLEGFDFDIWRVFV